MAAAEVEVEVVVVMVETGGGNADLGRFGCFRSSRGLVTVVASRTRVQQIRRRMNIYIFFESDPGKSF